MSDGARIPYSRHVVEIGNRRDLRHAIQKMTALDGLIVVNLVEASGIGAVALSEENLRAILSDAPASILVEAMPRTAYNQVMRGKIEQVVQEAVALRDALRVRAVVTLGAEVTSVIRHLEQTIFLLKGYALQRPRPNLQKQIHAIEGLRVQLARSSFDLTDNVRCMDDVYYEILPALKALGAVFR